MPTLTDYYFQYWFSRLMRQPINYLARLRKVNRFGKKKNSNTMCSHFLDKSSSGESNAPELGYYWQIYQLLSTVIKERGY